MASGSQHFRNVQNYTFLDGGFSMSFDCHVYVCYSIDLGDYLCTLFYCCCRIIVELFVQVCSWDQARFPVFIHNVSILETLGFISNHYISINLCRFICTFISLKWSVFEIFDYLFDLWQIFLCHDPFDFWMCRLKRHVWMPREHIPYVLYTQGPMKLWVEYTRLFFKKDNKPWGCVALKQLSISRTSNRTFGSCRS